MRYKSTMSTYLNPDIEYLFNVDLMEYDCQDAGFSIIKQFNLLDDSTIRQLEGMDKMERHIQVGKLQGSDKEFSKRFMNKFAEVRNLFITMNDLTDNDIISVKRDAIFTTKECKRTNFGKVKFRIKNQYSSYLRFPENRNLEIYYADDKIDIKGMGDMAIDRHRIYLIEFIRTLINYIEEQNASAGHRFFMNFIKKYKSSELEEEYYIEFNNVSRKIDPMFNFKELLIPLAEIMMKEL